MGFAKKGVHPAREVNRAHLLMALDSGIAETTICQVLGLGRTALWRTRAAYRQGGLEFALRDETRPGQPRKYRTNEEAEVGRWQQQRNAAGRGIDGNSRARTRIASSVAIMFRNYVVIILVLPRIGLRQHHATQSWPVLIGYSQPVFEL
jgi:hypothetical protein